jgi:high-affinity iron transporter
MRLGHAGPRPGRVAAFGLDELARSTDAELRERLRGAVEPREVGAALAFLRTEAPFVAPSASEGIAMARTFLDRADVAYREGRTGDAERALVDAYLKGFEPLEPTLIARDPDLVQELESAFGELRRSIALRVAAQEFSGQVASLERRLHDAVGGARVLTPFLSAFVVVLREGVEAALLIAALLAGARRLGRAHAARGIHVGWIAALPAGVLTWWVFDRLVRAGAAQRELVEALVTLAAAVVLFSVSSWMLSRTNPRRWSDGVQRSLTNSLGAATPWPVIGLAFLAVYREAAETVLFLQAILLDARGAESQVWAGGAAGLLLSFACAFVMTRAIARLPLTPFFAVTGVLLSLLAVSFAGSGIYTLVVAGHLKARPVQFPEIPWMGIHPDLSGLLVQLAIAATLVLGALLTHGRREAAASASDSRRDG